MSLKSAAGLTALCILSATTARGVDVPIAGANGLSLNPVQPLMLGDAIGGNPADVGGHDSNSQAKLAPTAVPPGTPYLPFPGPIHSWQLPAVEVVGQQPSELREEDRIGGYQQPRWTADRRFAETRIYVIPEGKVEFEYWLKAEVPHHGATQIKQMFELEIGLPYRFQMDVYVIDRHEGSGGQAFIDGQLEFRWALADWNKIWGNPTLYIEYKSIDSDPDEIEAKLLLGGEIAPRWHWGANIVWDAQTGGTRETSYELAGGISYTLLDEKLSVGAEIHFELIDEHGSRFNYENELFIGPSIQYRPLPNMHIDLAPLVGCTSGGSLEGFLIIGYEF